MFTCSQAKSSSRESFRALTSIQSNLRSLCFPERSPICRSETMNARLLSIAVTIILALGLARPITASRSLKATIASNATCSTLASTTAVKCLQFNVAIFTDPTFYALPIGISLSKASKSFVYKVESDAALCFRGHIGSVCPLSSVMLTTFICLEGLQASFPSLCIAYEDVLCKPLITLIVVHLMQSPPMMHTCLPTMVWIQRWTQSAAMLLAISVW